VNKSKTDVGERGGLAYIKYPSSNWEGSNDGTANEQSHPMKHIPY